MDVTADVTVVPLGVGDSLSPYIAACEEILSKTGDRTLIHAHGTNIDGDLDNIPNAVKNCQQRMHEMGAPCVETQLRFVSHRDGATDIDTRVGRVIETLSRNAQVESE